MNIVFVGDQLTIRTDSVNLLNLIQLICMRGEIPKDYIPSIIDENVLKLDGVADPVILDNCAGKQENDGMWPSSFKNKDGFIVCFRMDKEDSILSINHWISNVKYYSPNAVITLLGITPSNYGKQSLSDGAFDALLTASKSHNAQLITAHIEDIQAIQKSVYTTVEAINKKQLALTAAKDDKNIIKHIVRFFKAPARQAHAEASASRRKPYFDDFIPNRAKEFRDAVITLSRGAKEKQTDSYFRHLPDELLMLIFDALNDIVAKEPQKAMLWAELLLNKYRNDQMQRSIEYKDRTFEI